MFPLPPRCLNKGTGKQAKGVEMKKLMMVLVTAAMAMGVMAETANTVKVTKFH